MSGGDDIVSPLATWFADPAALARFRHRQLGRAPLILRPRDHRWRDVAPDFAGALAMARAGLPFQIARERRYDRTADPRRLRAALASGASVFLPQVHQVLPRLMRLMVALRAALLGPLREECSFLFLVEGQGRTAMGLHHDGPVDAFWLQLAGRRTVTLGPRVAAGTPQDVRGPAGRGHGWRTLTLSPGTLFHLPPWTPHDVVCHGRSLALSLTWRRRRRPVARASAAWTRGLVAWDVVSGRIDRMPATSRRRLFTQVPAVVRGDSLVTAEGALSLPAPARAVARRLAEMPSVLRPTTPRGRDALAVLVDHGILAPQDLPRRIAPARPRALDGWRFA